jgi:hypothetical protein
MQTPTLLNNNFFKQGLLARKKKNKISGHHRA